MRTADYIKAYILAHLEEANGFLPRYLLLRRLQRQVTPQKLDEILHNMEQEELIETELIRSKRPGRPRMEIRIKAKAKSKPMCEPRSCSECGMVVSAGTCACS